MGDNWRVLGDDWRVSIASRYLPELMSPQSLTREVSRRLGYQVKASGGNGQEVVWYAPSGGLADEIAQAAREVLAREVLARPDAGRHWSASVVRTERAADGGWLVCLASGDLPELMSQQRLTREVSSRLGYQVQASGGRSSGPPPAADRLMRSRRRRVRCSRVRCSRGPTPAITGERPSSGRSAGSDGGRPGGM